MLVKDKKQNKVLDKDFYKTYNVLNKRGGEKMSEKEKEILKKIAEVLPHMDEEDKEILVEKADSMAYMNRKWKKKLSEEEKAKEVV